MAAAKQPQPRGRGRPPAPPGRALTGRVRARVTPEQQAKFEALGGSSWLRVALARAKLPRPPRIPPAPLIAPWPDFAGNPIREGDQIRHPSGQIGTVVLEPGEGSPQSRWRVDYGDGFPTCALCLQIGEKGQAEVVQISSKEQQP